MKYLFTAVFFGHKPDWIKYLDSITGLGSDWTRHKICWIRIAKISDPFNTGRGVKIWCSRDL